MKKYNLFLDDVRTPEICTTYYVPWLTQNKGMYVLEDWKQAKTHNEFTDLVEHWWISGEFPEKVSFDHDLADEHYQAYIDCVEKGLPFPDNFNEKTGNDSAKWLVQFCIDKNISLPTCFVHTQNSVGAERIINSLKGWERYQKFVTSGRGKDAEDVSYSEE